MNLKSLLYSNRRNVWLSGTKNAGVQNKDIASHYQSPFEAKGPRKCDGDTYQT